MTPPSILLDGTQLLKKRGTGIASYTRTLAKALHSLGARVQLLFGASAHVRKGDPDFTLATQIFGNQPPGRLYRLGPMGMLAIRSAFGLKHTIGAVKVGLNQIDLRFFDPPLPPFDGVLNADSSLERAAIASLWGRPMITVLPPERIAACHWTGPVPLKSSIGPNLYTIHDLVPVQFPYFVIGTPGGSARLHDAIAKTADGIITVSEASKSKILDILKLPPERVAVTHQPVPTPVPIAREDAERIVSAMYDVKPGSYVLYLGAIEPKKNIRRLIEAYLTARLDIPLLLVGPKGWLYEEEDELLAAIERTGRSAATIARNLFVGPPSDLPVRHLGYLPRRHITALLKCAKFFVFPSFYEGFGLPVLEAMHHGVPVLTSQTPSLREVAGDAAFFVDPVNTDDIARGIGILDADNEIRAELAAKGPLQAAKFSEQAYAQKLVAAYAQFGVTLPIMRGERDSDPAPEPAVHAVGVVA